jgi:hypothetical protein
MEESMTRKLALLVLAAAIAVLAAVGTRPTAAQTCPQQTCPPRTYLFCCSGYSFCCPDGALCACRN